MMSLAKALIKEGEKGSFFIEPSASLIEEYLDEYNKRRPLTPAEEAAKNAGKKK